MKDEDVINKILLGNTGSDPKACNEWSNRNGEDEADIRKMKNIWDVANPAFRPDFRKKLLPSGFLHSGDHIISSHLPDIH